MKDIKEELRVFEEGLAELISKEGLEKKLERSHREKKPLKIKYGADPSSPNIHLGHTVPLRKLRSLQDLGHQVIFIIGDFTARIGDPSMQSETRKMLTKAEVLQNAKTYEKQIYKILDPKRTTIRFNSEWLDKMGSSKFLELASKYTVARILEREDFKTRFESRRPIAILEFLYPLLQGYDSVVLASDVELGGTDQKFNLLVGRELMRDYGSEPQIVMTLPIIEGTDGVQKMSKSLGNAIGIEESPKEIFGKVMSIPDTLLIRYYKYLTPLRGSEVDALKKGLDSGKENPRDLKARLARTIVAQYHGREEAEKAGEEFDQIFKRKEVPSELPEVTISGSHLDHGSIDIIDLLQEAKLTTSKSEARRMIDQGGVKVNSQPVRDWREKVTIKEPVVVQCGKRKFARVKVK